METISLNIQLTEVYTEPEPPLPDTEPESIKAWIKPDPLTNKFEFAVRVNGLTEVGKGTPCVFPFGKKGSATRKYHSLYANPIVMDKKTQFFMADLLAFQKYGKSFLELSGSQKNIIISRYESLYHNNRAYNNGQGYGKGPKANYLNGSDLDAEKPKMFSLLDATNSHLVKEIDGDYVLLDTFIEGQLPTNYGIEILQDYRISWCTIIKPKLPLENLTLEERQKVDYTCFQFPQLDGLSVPRPQITKEPAWFWKDEVELYTEGRKLLYIPPRPGEL